MTGPGPDGPTKDAPAVRWTPKPQVCPGCGSDGRTHLGKRGGKSHRMGLGVETSIVRCRRCHLVYPSPALLPEGNPYAAFDMDEYFHHDRAAKLETGRKFATTAERLLGRKGRLLELGCGQGDLLVAAAERGWSVRGVDMTPGFSAHQNGLEIETASVEEAKSLDETWDVLYLAAILEHLYDPLTCLRRVRRALAPDGIVLIDVPNECSLWSDIANAYLHTRGRDWAVNLSPTFPPFHVVGFCPTSLRSLLRAAGFTVVELKTIGWPVDIPETAGVVASVEQGAARAVAAIGGLIGRGTGILCWARRAAGEPT